MNKNLANGGERIVKTSINWDAADTSFLAFLAGRFTYRSAEEWKLLIADGTVTINGKTACSETLLRLHDVVEYRPGELEEPPAELSYRKLYEDKHILVLDKPGNLCVHPAGPFFKHTLWYLLRAEYGENIHFVNRLDRETSGAMIVAFDPGTAAALEKTPAEKIYHVIVHGDFPENATAEGFLFHDDASLIRKKRRFSVEKPENAKAETAQTFFRKLAGNGVFSLLEARLGTGRMHQIRATLSSLGYPVVGDKLYGLSEAFYLRQKHDELTENDMKKLILPRQALHSFEIVFSVPGSREKLVVRADEPEEFRQDGFPRA